MTTQMKLKIDADIKRNARAYTLQTLRVMRKHDELRPMTLDQIRRMANKVAVTGQILRNRHHKPTKVTA